MTFDVDNGIAIMTDGFPSPNSIGEGRVLGSLKYEVRNGIGLDDDRAPSKVEPIDKIVVEKLKVPISDGHIPTPTFSVAY